MKNARGRFSFAVVCTYFGCIRIAPSRRITSPLSIGVLDYLAHQQHVFVRFAEPRREGHHRIEHDLAACLREHAGRSGAEARCAARDRKDVAGRESPSRSPWLGPMPVDRSKAGASAFDRLYGAPARPARPCGSWSDETEEADEKKPPGKGGLRGHDAVLTSVRRTHARGFRPRCRGPRSCDTAGPSGRFPRRAAPSRRST